MLFLIPISSVLVVVNDWFALTIFLSGVGCSFFLGYWTHYAIVKAKENNLKQDNDEKTGS